VRPTIVPVDLGGSPTPCRVRPPLRPPPDPETLRALVRHYTEDRSPPGPVEAVVAFFRGGLPPEALLDAATGHPLRLSCSPADLDRAAATRLQAHGMRRVELEVLTLDPSVLRRLVRGYTATRALQMVPALQEMGLEVGVVLAPGLPGASHAGALADADRLLAEARPDFVRIHPALAIEGSGLAELARRGDWAPMRLGEAVTTCEALLDRFDAAEVPVIRVGRQPGSDFPERVVAGPVHPSLRGLVEARRYRRRMEAALRGHPRARPAVLAVHPADLSWAKGTANANVKALRSALGMRALAVEPDPAVPRGRVVCRAPATGR
jgi:hypothetical protein